MSALGVTDVSVRFGTTTVLDDVSLAVADGEIVALLGPSGSGKSTLLRVIAGLLVPDTGRVEIDGVDVTDLATHRRGVGMVFQDEQLFPHRDVGENVAFGLRMTGVARPARDARVEEMLALVGLAGFDRRRVTDLSGGEAKRVALARALSPSPRVLLLDEPLTGLDTDLHDRLAIDLRAVLRSTGTTAVHVTHDRTEADVVADRVVTLDALRARSSPGSPGSAPTDR
jgi:thiamine transport system ATP-binding protein